MSTEIIEIPLRKILPFIHRDRDSEPFERMKASMAERGQKIAIEVRDITHRPRKERTAPDGTVCDWQLIKGEGRCKAAMELGWKTIKGKVFVGKESEIVGRFMVENMIRRPLPWYQLAVLIKADLDAGMSEEEVAKLHFRTVAHIQKCRRILSKTAVEIREEIAVMPMNDAEVLTALPESDQSIVVEVLKESGDLYDVKAVAAKARAIREETGSMSPTALRASIKRVEDELAETKKRMKVTRVHHANGPGSLLALLESPDFRRALKKAGVSTAKFEAVLK